MSESGARGLRSAYGEGMSSDDDEVRVSRNEAESRYEIHVGDALAGYTTFEADAQHRQVFPHTKVDPAFGGRGLGKTLVAEAMHDVADRGQTVVPKCPFVVRYLKENTVPGLDVVLPEEPDAE